MPPLILLVAWVLVTSAPPIDPTVQYTGIAALVTAVGVIAVAVWKSASADRRDTAAQDNQRSDDRTLAAKQRTELLDPLLKEVDRLRVERDAANARADRAGTDRATLMALCLEHGVVIPPEVSRP